MEVNVNEILNKYIDNMKNEIINSTCEIINIPSVFNDNDCTPLEFIQ